MPDGVPFFLQNWLEKNSPNRTEIFGKISCEHTRRLR